MKEYTTKGEYNAYMKSDRWDKKRRKRLEIDKYKCQDCFRRDRPLDVHHLTYDRLGYEDMGDLLSLCRECHNSRHKKGVWFFAVCQTCGGFLSILKQWLSDGWTRWTCEDGHINEKRGWHE
jgi:hypothetical protein